MNFIYYDLQECPVDAIGGHPIAKALCECDVLCVCTGPFIQKEMHLMSPSEWAFMALGNYALYGAAVSMALPKMMEKHFGRIVLFGGTRTESIRSYKTNAAYAGAKTGISVIVKSVASCYAQYGITCNAIMPGFTHDAPINTSIIEEERLAFHTLYLIEHPELNGVLLNVDKGWQP